MAYLSSFGCGNTPERLEKFVEQVTRGLPQVEGFPQRDLSNIWDKKCQDSM